MLRKVMERPRGAPSSGVLRSAVSNMREQTPLTSDARRMPLGVATPIDSSSGAGWGKHYLKNLR